MENVNGTLTDALAAEIRAEMARQNIKQVDLASDVDLKPIPLMRRLSGKIPFALNELQAVSIRLGVRPGELVARAEASLTARAS